MNHYVYEITNLVNGRKYIGKRSCHCEISKDRYMGSGKALMKAINKYGINNFEKKIVFVCNSEDEAYEKEKEYIFINNAVRSKDYYNLCEGGKGVGSGEDNHRYGKKISEKHKEILIKSNKNRIVSDETRRKMSESLKGKMAGENNPFYGKKHTSETILKISIASSNKVMSKEARFKISKSLKGEKSPMYGISKSEEIKQKISESRKGKLVGGDNPWARKIICITTGEEFNSLAEASRKYNIGIPNITACCRGRRKRTGGLEWKYYD